MLYEFRHIDYADQVVDQWPRWYLRILVNNRCVLSRGSNIDNTESRHGFFLASNIRLGHR